MGVQSHFNKCFCLENGKFSLYIIYDTKRTAIMENGYFIVIQLFHDFNVKLFICNLSR